MSRNGKVIVAMSGGVDSSVAACLLHEQGYECVGVFMRVGAHTPEPAETCALAEVMGAGPGDGRGDGATPSDAPARGLKHGCCSAADAIVARAIAGRLDIPFYALNFERDFDRIITYFVDEYARGRTPNPCVMCNNQLKFGKLLRYADMMDAEFVATGHYARILRRDDGVYLARSLNEAKDQSYVLFGLPRDELPRCLFPLGEIAEKADVRRIAANLDLRVHDKPDSQEICFVPNDDYRQIVRQRRPEAVRPGEVRDTAGKVLGMHEGVADFTIGQRRGLGIATGRPVYVTRLDVITNTVTVGTREELSSGGLIAERVNWLVDAAGIGRLRISESQISGSEISGSEISGLKISDSATSQSETSQSEIPESRIAESEIAESEIAESEVAGSKIAGSEISNSQISNSEIPNPNSPESMNQAFAGIRVGIKIRYLHTPAPGWVRPVSQASAVGMERSSTLPSAVEARFDQQQPAVTPGQAAVFYGDDQIVLGGGWIRESIGVEPGSRDDEAIVGPR